MMKMAGSANGPDDARDLEGGEIGSTVTKGTGYAVEDGCRTRVSWA